MPPQRLTETGTVQRDVHWTRSRQSVELPTLMLRDTLAIPYSLVVPAITVSVIIERSPEQVWSYVRDIASHVEWMADAAAIRFISDQVEGTGTTFECDTEIGPIKLTDVMRITSWEDEARMGVRHEGIVTGEGEFVLTEQGEGQTLFVWWEDLTFPWWMAGPIGAFVARPVLGGVWKRNLKKLKQTMESR